MLRRFNTGYGSLRLLLLLLILFFIQVSAKAFPPNVKNGLIISGEKTAFTPLADITITGKVTGANGEPMGGVSVTIKGTSQGVSTDAAGNYSIVAGETATLIISSVGYGTQEIPVGGRTPLIPPLPPRHHSWNRWWWLDTEPSARETLPVL